MKKFVYFGSLIYYIYMMLVAMDAHDLFLVDSKLPASSQLRMSTRGDLCLSKTHSAEAGFKNENAAIQFLRIEVLAVFANLGMLFFFLAG